MTFGPLTSKATAMAAVSQLQMWIKREEERLFVTSPVIL